MNKLYFTFILLFILSSTGCDEKQNTPSSNIATAFNLTQVQEQYAEVNLEVADISEQSYKQGAALAITLSTPLNPEKDFQDFFKVSNKEGQIVTGNWVISANGLSAYFPEIEPSSTYIIDVFKGLTSATGKQLTTGITKKLITRKMPAQVSFGSRGSVLPAKLAKGLPVVSVNINEVDIDFHRIKANKISHFIASWHKHSGRSTQSGYYLEQYAPYTELVYSARFALEPPKNTRYTTHLDLTAIDKLKPEGIYLAVMKPAGTYKYNKQVTFFTVSDIGIHARMYADKMNIQVSSLATGKAISGVSLNLLDAKSKSLEELQSDSQGQATFVSPSHKAKLLIARYKNNIALLRLNSPALDLSEFKVTGRSYNPVEIFTYGPRDLYRPGETVKINALLRDADGKSMTALPINAVIQRPDGQQIKYFVWHANNDTKKQGFYQTEYTLPKNAQTGRWSLQLKTSDKNSHQYFFQVAAFLPERMELLLGDQPTQQRWINRNDTININVSGQYLYGAPAAKNRLSSKVMITPNRHPLLSHQEYYFGLTDEKPPVEFYQQGDIRLNKQGLATLVIPSRWKEIKNSPFTIKVIASLFETGGRPVTRSIKTTLWPQDSLLGIRPTIKLDDIPANTSMSFDFINVNSDGVLQDKADIVVSLIKEQRNYYWEYSDAEGWHYEQTENNIKAFQKSLSLSKEKASTLSLPVEWGSYLIIAKNLKTGQSSSLRFNAGSGWHQQQNTDSARPDRVVLRLDKKNYQAGETAQLHILPPYAGNGFVMLENSEEPLWFQRVSIPAEGLNIQIPVKKNWNRHDLYLSTVIFRSGNAKEKITPNRAVGLIPFPLNRKNRQLSVSIKTPNTIIRPEKTLTTEIKVSGFGADKKIYLTLAAVDVGVLNITDFKTPDPYQWFFQPRRYAVEQRDIYNKIIELTEGGLTKPRFGGDVDKHAGGARPDSSVKIVSLFSQLVQADKQGTAKIDLELPDFNGRLRLMAVAFNNDQFGTADTEITVAAPIIAETSLPRFLASSDKAIMTLDIRNQSGQQQNLSLSVDASSPIKLSNDNRQNNIASFALKDQEKKVLHFPIIANNGFGQSKINIHLSNKDKSILINRERFLGVRPAYPAVNFIDRKIVSAGESVTIKPNLKKLILTSVSSHLSISAQPPINIKQHLKNLLRYPYGCLEQTISSSYPWLSLNQENLTLLDWKNIKINNKALDIKQRFNHIETGLNKIASMQRNNGSFGLWSNIDQEEHWLTAYAADFMLSAQQKGALVPEQLLNKTLTRLTQYINHRGNMYGERYSQAPGHYNFAYKAYAGYVLSRVNRAPLGSLRTLFDHHKKDAKSALPLAHLGLALYKQGDKNRGLQAIRESLTKPRNNLIYLGDYGSRLRDISIMTYLFNHHSVPVAETKTLIYQLSDELNNRHYLSTQERIALLHVGIALSSKNDESWQGTLLLDKVTTKLQQAGPYNNQFISKETPKTIQLKTAKNSNHPLYLQFGISAYPKVAPKMHMEHINVERNYYDLEGQSLNPKRHQSGDVLLVHLTVRADQRIKDALVIDLIPAGFELENQNLSNSLKTAEFKVEGKTIEEMQRYNQVKHQEYLDDRYVAAIDLHKNQPEHLFYLIRAVTPGSYTNPPPFVEDMYRPYIRAIGRSFEDIEVISKQ